MEQHKNYDVIIIGGSYAGLSAAMSLLRSLRTVLIIDSGIPCNRQTPRSHNFITHDGEKPHVIAAKAKQQVLSYPTAAFTNAYAVSTQKTGTGFSVNTDSGQTFESKIIVFASGIKDIMPPIPGFSDCWGISVIHCPYCHGYEARSLKTGIMANSERAYHLASLVNNLTDDITILTNGKAQFDPSQSSKFDKHHIKIIEKEIAAIEHYNGRIENVIFKDGSKEGFKAVYAALPFVQHSGIPQALGCQLTEQGYIKVDPFQSTTVPGVFACGDNSGMMRSVANAVASGSLTGAMVNKSLTDSSF